MTMREEYFTRLQAFNEADPGFYEICGAFFNSLRKLELFTEVELGAIVSADPNDRQRRQDLYDRLPVEFQRRHDAFLAICHRRQDEWAKLLALSDSAFREAA